MIYITSSIDNYLQKAQKHLDRAIKMDANNITVLELRARCFADQNMYR